MFSLEVLKGLNDEKAERDEQLRKEKAEILERAGLCETPEDFRNLIGFLIDTYILPEGKNTPEFKSRLIFDDLVD